MPRYEFSEINEEQDAVEWFLAIVAENLMSAVLSAAEEFHEQTGELHAQFFVACGDETKIIEVTGRMTSVWEFTEVPRKDS